MESKKLEKPCENATFQALQGVMKPDEETGGVFPTMKTLGGVKSENGVNSKEVSTPNSEPEKIDFSQYKD